MLRYYSKPFAFIHSHPSHTFKTCFRLIPDFDEIKQDISSFRYEMLNHISVRQMETAENKDRLDRLYNKIDSVLLQQKQLARVVSSGVFGTDESNIELKESLSSHSDSQSTMRTCSTATSSFADDDDEITKADLQRFKKATASVKSLKEIPEERSKSEPEVPKYSPKPSPTKRSASLKRQDGMSSSTEDSTGSSVEVRDVQVHVMTSPHRSLSKDERRLSKDERL